MNSDCLVRCLWMRKGRPLLFRGRHFEDQIVILCVRWYLPYSLSYRDLQELMAERALSVDHTTMWRLVHRYAPILNSGFAGTDDIRIDPGGWTRPTFTLRKLVVSVSRCRLGRGHDRFHAVAQP